MRILLVEDSLAIRRANESALLKAGYEVTCAEDGETALQVAQQQKPDLILLDMILPKMNGPDVLRHLKNEPGTAAIPVVVLSSLTEKNRQKLMDEGAEEYLEKNTLMPLPGMNLLPKMLENIICRINRRRGIAFTDVPIPK
ncbi:MAG: response regulator [Candidatus Sulfotelmatobacter sp.]